MSEFKIKEWKESLRQEYGFHFVNHFDLPKGYCHGDLDGDGNLYFQEGFLPVGSCSNILVKNVFTNKEYEIDIKFSGKKYIRLNNDQIFASGRSPIVTYDKKGEIIVEFGEKIPEEYLLDIPSDMIFKNESVLVSDLNSSRILRYGLDGRFEDIFLIDPYSCVVSMKEITDDLLLLSLRSMNWEILSSLINKDFSTFSQKINTQAHDLITYNLKTKLVKPFADIYADQEFINVMRSSSAIHDFEIDYPYLYVVMRIDKVNYLIKFDMQKNKTVFYYNLSSHLTRLVYSGNKYFF